MGCDELSLHTADEHPQIVNEDERCEPPGEQRDNDFDGKIDEGLECCPVRDDSRACGVGECRSQQVCRGDFQWSRCPGPDLATDEELDGLDNDCDERVDEGLGFPPEEECGDGLDNDFDGRADELDACECLSGEARPCGFNQGVCRVGVDTCAANGRWGGCNGLAQQRAEECDGLDNDCDGGVDESLHRLAVNQDGVCSGSVQVCRGVAGWFEPERDLIAGYEETETSCDGRDNDCDGLTDESLPAPSASRQEGVCAGASKVCGREEETARWMEPDYAGIEAYEPEEQRCDGLDNDCDGQADEALEPADATNQLGICAGSLRICSGRAGWRDPSPDELANGEALEESCDGLDNDCDGETDEVADLFLPLADRQDGVCAGATRQCVAGGQLIEPDYPRIIGFEGAEISCDGQDNDCDAQVDEGLSRPAREDHSGICAAAEERCAAGVWVADFASVPGYEIDELSCDQRDNDCDGRLDEGVECFDEVWDVRRAIGNALGGQALSFPEQASGPYYDSARRRIYVTTSNQILAYDMEQREFFVLAGTGDAGFSGDGGPAVLARLNFGDDTQMAFDASGNLFFSDTQNSRVRRIDSSSHVITTSAGGGQGDADGLQALETRLDEPGALAVDSAGNLYVHTEYRLRRIAAGTGIVTTIAGDGQSDPGEAEDDVALGALPIPGSMRLVIDRDTDRLYYPRSHRIRGIDLIEERAFILAGTGVAGDVSPGAPAGESDLDTPRELVVHGGGLWLLAGSQQDRQLHRVDLASGTIDSVRAWANGRFALAAGEQIAFIDRRLKQLVAGWRLGEAFDPLATGPSVDDLRPSPRLATRLGNPPLGLAVRDNHEVYVSTHVIQDGSSFRAIRVMDPASGVVSHFGGARDGSEDDGVDVRQLLLGSAEEHLVLDPNGHVYIDDLCRVRLIHQVSRVAAVVAGSGECGYAGDGGPARAADLAWVSGLALDSTNNLIVGHESRIRRISAQTGLIETVAGTGDVPEGEERQVAGEVPALGHDIEVLGGLTVTAEDDIVFFDSARARIRKIDAETSLVTTIAGNGDRFVPLVVDGRLATDLPLGEAEDLISGPDGSLYFFDPGGGRIMKIDNSGRYEMVAGTGIPAWEHARGDEAARLARVDGRPATSTPLAPVSMTLGPDGVVYFSDFVEVPDQPEEDTRIRRINPQTGVIETIIGDILPAGVGPVDESWVPGPGTMIPRPGGVGWLITGAVGGYVYSLDAAREQLDVAVGYRLGMQDGDYPAGVRPAEWDEDEVPAHLAHPMSGSTGLAYDTRDNVLWITEREAHTLRRVRMHDPDDHTTWSTRTFAGAVGEPGGRDGPPAQARFASPAGVALDAQARRLFIVDSGVSGQHPSAIRVFDLDRHTVSTLRIGEDADGPLLRDPSHVAFGGGDILWVTDASSHRLFQVTLAGDGRQATAVSVLGDGGDRVREFVRGTSAGAVSTPALGGVAVTPDGNIFVSSANRILHLSGRDGVPTAEDPVAVIYQADPEAPVPGHVGSLARSGVQILGPLHWSEGEGALYAFEMVRGRLLRLERRP